MLKGEPMEYICRKLNVGDIAMVMDMNKNYRENFICYDNAMQFLQNEQHWMFSAIHNNTIIGFAYGYELQRLDSIGNMLYIHEVGVMKDYQKQGVGYRLLTELKDCCREKNICRYFLSTYQNNEPANALYKKLNGTVSAESNGNDTNYFFKVT